MKKHSILFESEIERKTHTPVTHPSHPTAPDRYVDRPNISPSKIEPSKEQPKITPNNPPKKG
jgi:hypothetical protein